MNARTFQSVEEWIAYCHKLTHSDLDNVILLAGDPGNGKSTLGLQLGKALDPSLTLDRVTFGVQEFITAARGSPPHSAILADELLAQRRKAMSKDNKDLVDFFQVCRGLNLHLIICFPHAAMLDSAIMTHRVRWRIDITMPAGPDGPRVAVVHEKRLRTIYNARGEEEFAIQWLPVLQFRFARNRGLFWEAYLAKKVSAARAREEPSGGPTPDAPSRPRAKKEKEWRGARGGTRERVQLRVRPTSPVAHLFPSAESKEPKSV